MSSPASVLLHNLFDPISSERFGCFANLWRLILDPGFVTYHGHPVVWSR